MHPLVHVIVDGAPVSGAFFDRLISLTVNDREGIQSDTVELNFNDGIPHLASPRRGAILSVTMMHGAGGGFVGSYVIDRVVNQFAPYTISVRGHSADLTSALKEGKTRHWDNKTVKQILQQIAGEHGLEARISDAVSGHLYAWIGQQDESDLNFLERVARRHGALFTIKNAVLLWLERGAGKTADGTTIPTAMITLSSILKGSGRVSETDVDRFRTVKAYWQDRAGAKRQEIVVDADPEGTGEHVLRDPYSSRAEAEAAARAAVREMLRGLVETTCSITGNPGLMAGQPVAYVGVRSGVDGQEFILETVTHSFSKSSGLRTTFKAKLKAQ